MVYTRIFDFVLSRQITVDNLLKLAKQFDFNMIHQESACIQPNSFSVEEDPDLSFNKDDSPASLHNDSKAVKASDCTEEVKTKNDDSMVFDLGMEDDLDLLFDTSTQQVSNNLSLSLNKCSQEVAKIDFDVDENLDAYTKLRNSFAAQLDRASESTSIKENIAIHNDTNFQKMHSTDDFDDDWSNDDLLEDSLVMEMTQNPELFSTTRKSSTQKLTRMNGNEKHSLYRNMNSFPHGRNQNLDAIDLKCSTTRGHNRSSRSFHQKNISAGTICNAQGFPSKNNWERQACPSNKFQSAASGSLSLKPYQPNVLTNTYQPTKSLEMLRPARAARTGFAHFLTKRSVVCSNPVQSSLVYNKNLADDKGNNPMTDNCDITVEDLDFIFATDDIWVDGADDDDLFCEACEKVEEFMNEPEPPKTIFAKSTLQNLENRITVSSNSRNTSINLSKPDQNWVFVPPQNQTSSITNNVHSGGITHNYENPSVENTVNNSLMKISSSFSEGCYKFNHIKSKPGLSSAAYKSKMQQPVCQIGTLTSQQSAPNILVDHQFNKPYSTLKAKPTNSQGKTFYTKRMVNAISFFFNIYPVSLFISSALMCLPLCIKGGVE